MVTVACYIVSRSCVSYVPDFHSVILLFSDTPVSVV
jgi:hypothetical protein